MKAEDVASAGEFVVATGLRSRGIRCKKAHLSDACPRVQAAKAHRWIPAALAVAADLDVCAYCSGEYVNRGGRHA